MNRGVLMISCYRAKSHRLLLSLTHFTLSASLSTTASLEEDKEVRRQCKWFTLPSFPGASLSPSISTAKTAKAPSTTALKWVLRCCPQVPRSLIQKLFRLRQVRKESLNPAIASCLHKQAQYQQIKRVFAKDTLNSGDRIFLPITVNPAVEVEDDYICNKEEMEYIRSLEVYKDAAIVVVNKPPGLPVQGGTGVKLSLDVLVASSLKYDYSEVPRLVHRLDQDSSGILVMGRTQESTTLLHSIFRDKTCGASFNDIKNSKIILKRKYWALVIGNPQPSEGLISAPLSKLLLDDGKSERITVSEDSKNKSARHAITEYRVLRSSGHGFTWLELYPRTGRKHQLRVHCAEVLGTPILGDYKYGWNAHRKWKPFPTLKFEERLNRKAPFGLDLEGGSVSDKKPRLHLHCRQMTLPNMSLAFQHLHEQSVDDLSKLEKLDLVAPLPLHMRRSWDILNSELF
ncbi:RNA pseudouridine synthase 4, mitochondrial isoform X2 [Amborella trichopoda]|uniref:RNA pseudouridine synthase 4, mitochondrial isoform X2 n=1 Tax=Amborella trichopoda TaxID=13333 RepID=UPI0009BDFC3F|nr:RNA pseudouridine synthase 4, mitochondrial isoform X2 [Amborella trichopoda]|eukprot:XP_011624446.2 RNA pseudouridine synthase 4, mitochondrial isoform X2 [Amborella trichopoda]